MTEDEAKTKWCPFTRTTGAGGGEAGTGWHTNRPSFADVEAEGFDRCIASTCMAWRVDKRYVLKTSPDQGHCGLAGSPHA